ncbi:MAG: RDD family protein, partial [Cyanobacteria bacterium]|nr:RDD family protein [Cyanobacteriota bacterium]
KPSNVVVSEDQGVESAAIIDFGIATILQSVRCDMTDVNRTGEIFGTPQYMSPEQCLGDTPDARSDVYSFGCLMYEAVTGRPPFNGFNPMQLITQHLDSPPQPFEEHVRSCPLAAKLEGVILKCLEKEPKFRYQNFDELKADLDKLAEGRPLIQRNFEPATFKRRLIASIVDGIILQQFIWQFLGPSSAFDWLFSGLNQIVLPYTGLMFWPAAWPYLWSFPSVSGGFAFLLCVYFCLFECSPLGATPGKLMFGLRVQNEDGQRISVRQGICRSLLRLISVLCWFVGSIIVRPPRVSILSALVKNLSVPVVDVMCGTRVMHQVKKPVSRSVRQQLKIRDISLADAYIYLSRSRIVILCLVGLMLAKWLNVFLEALIPFGLRGFAMFMIPACFFYVLFLVQCKRLQGKQSLEHGRSWTTLFMRSLKHGGK